jgi:hypothetical protein
MWAIVKDDPIHSAEANSQRLLPGLGAGVRNSCLVRWSLSLGLLISVTGLSLAAEPSTAAVIAGVPLSIHVIRLQRADPEYQIQSIHALGEAVGLDTLSHQLGLVKPALGAVVAAINGDYYQREKSFAGAARGLQIMDGELLSGPSGEVSFWIDAVGEPHADIVASQFQITWPDGTVTAFGLNGERQAGGVELYTPAIGPSTHTTGGSEIILARSEGGPWLPLRIGRTYTARVQEIRASRASKSAIPCAFPRRRVPLCTGSGRPSAAGRCWFGTGSRFG